MDQRLSGTARAYLDLVHAIIIVLKPSGAVAFVNEWTARVMEYPRDEIVGKNFFDNFQPEEAVVDARHNFHLLVSTSGGKLQRESSVKTASGSIIPIHWHHSVLRDEQGRILGTLSSGEDVTEKHILRQRLAQERAESRRQMMQAVLQRAEQERNELSHLLHDSVNQKLTVCKLLLNQAMADNEVFPAVQRSEKVIQEVIGDLRELSHGLNAYGLRKGGLEQAIRELAETISALGTMAVDLRLQGARYLKQLPAETAIALFRIVQENTGNTLKHADATRIRIFLSGSAQAVDLEIQDNGRGFERNSVEKGMGLSTIYSRAEVLGGRAYVSSRAGEGTLLSVHIPFS